MAPTLILTEVLDRLLNLTISSQFSHSFPYIKHDIQLNSKQNINGTFGEEGI